MEVTADSPRVSRSALVEPGVVVNLAGHQFEDGLPRYVVGNEVTPSAVEKLTAAVCAHEEAEAMMRAAITALNEEGSSDELHEA